MVIYRREYISTKDGDWLLECVTNLANCCRIFLKLSTYLRSRLLSIRLVARETMQNILMEIGPEYLPRLLSEMMSILTKGFQVHVLVFTCHAILEKVQNLFTEGQIDACIDPVLEVGIDIFK